MDLLVPKNNFDEVLDDIEKEKVMRFLDDPETVEAVRKVLLYSIYSAGALYKGQKAYNPEENVLLSFAANPELSQQQKGAIAETMIAGVTVVQKGFHALKTFERPPKVEETNKKSGK